MFITIPSKTQCKFGGHAIGKFYKTFLLLYESSIPWLKNNNKDNYFIVYFFFLYQYSFLVKVDMNMTTRMYDV